jgi:hypothetical protein
MRSAAPLMRGLALSWIHQINLACNTVSGFGAETRRGLPLSAKLCFIALSAITPFANAKSMISNLALSDEIESRQ